MYPKTHLTNRILAIALVASTCASARDRHSALMRDGSFLTGERVYNLDEPVRPPTLTKTNLLRQSNPVRVLRDTTKTVEPIGPHIELTNGDVLPGVITKSVEPESHDGFPAHFIVRQVSPNADLVVRSDRIRIQQRDVKRIVRGTRAVADLRNGEMFLRDGRRIVANRIQWTAGGIELISKAGIGRVSFADVLDFRVPHANVTEGVLRDSSWHEIYPDDFLVRIHATDGTQLTFPHSRVLKDVEDNRTRKRGRKRRDDYVPSIAVQPMWSLDAILLADDRIALRTYRDYGEIPLSLLPIVYVQQESGLFPWHWRRNQNVRSKLLSSGSMVADLGLGTHSYCEIAFELPPGATEFSAYVGLDRSVGRGGCVRCRIYCDDADRDPIWSSDFIRGSSDVTRVGPLPVNGAQRLILVTDYGHDGRPSGADPHDIRDHLNWILPMVRVDRDHLTRQTLADWIPQLRGWSIREADRKRVTILPTWSDDELAWRNAMRIDADKSVADSLPLRLSQKVTISLANSFLPIAVVRDEDEKGAHVVNVEVNGQRHGSTMNGDIDTTRAKRWERSSRVWIFGEFANQEVEVAIVVHQHGNRSARPSSLLWKYAMLRPLIDNLPNNGKSIAPEIPIASLTPVKTSIAGNKVLAPEKLSNGQPLTIRGYPFTDGLIVGVGSDITYELDPAWKRFVALIGLADGWKGAGPYQILLDDQVHWSSPSHHYSRNDPGYQIDIAIPPGHKTITLRLLGTASYGAWADAGFLR